MTIEITYKPNEQYLQVEGTECAHEDVELEDFTTDYMSFDGPNQWESTEPVCQVCGEVLEMNRDYED